MQTVDLERMTRDYRLVEKRFGSEIMYRFEPRRTVNPAYSWALLAGSLLWIAAVIGGFEVWKWWHR